MNYIAKIVYDNTDYYIRAVTLHTIDENGDNIAAGKIPSADGKGGLSWTSTSVGVQSFGGVSGDITVSGTLQMSGNMVSCVGMSYEAATPSADYTGGGYKVAILSTDPGAGNYKTGWLYFILE